MFGGRGLQKLPLRLHMWVNQLYLLLIVSPKIFVLLVARIFIVPVFIFGVHCVYDIYEGLGFVYSKEGP